MVVMRMMSSMSPSISSVCHLHLRILATPSAIKRIIIIIIDLVKAMTRLIVHQVWLASNGTTESFSSHSQSTTSTYSWMAILKNRYSLKPSFNQHKVSLQLVPLPRPLKYLHSMQHLYHVQAYIQFHVS